MDKFIVKIAENSYDDTGKINDFINSYKKDLEENKKHIPEDQERTIIFKSKEDCIAYDHYEPQIKIVYKKCIKCGENIWDEEKQVSRGNFCIECKGAFKKKMEGKREKVITKINKTINKTDDLPFLEDSDDEDF